MKHEPKKLQELREALANFSQPMVKIRRNGSAPHYSRAKLINIIGDKAIVLPLKRHRKKEEYPLMDLLLWQSATLDNESHLTSPTEKYVELINRAAAEDAVANSSGKEERKPTGTNDPTKEWLGKNSETVELILLDIFQPLDNKLKAQILNKPVGHFLKRYVLNNKRNFREILDRLQHEADVLLTEKRVRKFFNNRASGTDGQSGVVEIYPSFATQARSEPKKVEPPVSITPQVEAPEIITPETTAPAADEEVIAMEEIQRAHRRVIRDHRGLSGDEKYEIEAALLGTPHLNDRLDGLGLDDAVAEVMCLQGMPITGGEVRHRRHQHWPSTPPPADPSQVLREALRDGSLTRGEVIKVLLESAEDSNPSDLMREISRIDLPDQPPLPPL
ncbi:MAG: hypothetical protein JJU11_10400 [Candidatus Sumerlaeia bacterium]|nr:hypothetical protein [Candidatus Sumerlaeia bacterium]